MDRRSTDKGELEKTIDYLRRLSYEHRKLLFYSLSALGALHFMLMVKEVTLLLLLSYLIALLMEPIVSYCEGLKISRTSCIMGIAGLGLLFLIVALLLALPVIVYEYGKLLKALPLYLQTVSERLRDYCTEDLGLDLPENTQELIDYLKDLVGMFDLSQLRDFLSATFSTLLQGYSFTLTVFNLFLLPFFVYYISRDLKILHRHVGSYMDPPLREKVSSVGGKILGHVYAFVRGQLIVAFSMAVMYSCALSLVGLKQALIVGVISGFLNVIPYFGFVVGLSIASIISFVTADSITLQLLLIWLSFFVVHGIEGTFLTPKIVGDSVGIHPLGVMVALVIGGKLLGLLGLVLAVPIAASLKVLLEYFFVEIVCPGVHADPGPDKD